VLLLLQAWLILAALSQLIFVAHWPMYLFGTLIPRLPALGVALVRMGVYSGMAFGLGTRSRAAWAGTILELARTFILLAFLALQRDWVLTGLVYPASWAQGLLSAALPLAFVANVALARGWRPGSSLEMHLAAAVRLLGGLCGLGSLWLRRQGSAFHIPARDQWRTVLREGAPIFVVLTACEFVALQIARWLQR
jgi:hypothetical protein